jgi:hypothetical protein
MRWGPWSWSRLTMATPADPRCCGTPDHRVRASGSSPGGPASGRDKTLPHALTAELTLQLPVRTKSKPLSMVASAIRASMTALLALCVPGVALARVASTAQPALWWRVGMKLLPAKVNTICTTMAIPIQKARLSRESGKYFASRKPNSMRLVSANRPEKK